MSKKSKSTKQIRAIDRIIKFQIDDGIESLTISGKEVLADVAIDRKANVTLFLNADPDKINEIQSLVPFVTVQTVQGGTETDKTKTVTLSQDLTQFALEIADNSKELATLIKSQSYIVLDLNGLVQKLLEIAGKLAELEQKNQEQDNRLTDIEAKDQEQDQRLTVLKEKNDSQDERLNEIDVTQEAHASKLAGLEQKNQEQDNRFTSTEAKDLEQDNRLTTLENDGQPKEQLYNVSTNTVVHTFSDGVPGFKIIVDEKNGDNNVFGYITVLYNNQNILDTIPLSQVELNNLFIVEGKRLIYFITRTDTGYVIYAGDKEPPLVFSSLDSMTVNSALFRENPNKENKHNIEVIEIQSAS